MLLYDIIPVIFGRKSDSTFTNVRSFICGGTKILMDNTFTTGVDTKLQSSPNLVESLCPTKVNVIP